MWRVLADHTTHGTPVVPVKRSGTLQVHILRLLLTAFMLIELEKLGIVAEVDYRVTLLLLLEVAVVALFEQGYLLLVVGAAGGMAPVGARRRAWKLKAVLLVVRLRKKRWVVLTSKLLLVGLVGGVLARRESFDGVAQLEHCLGGLFVDCCSKGGRCWCYGAYILLLADFSHDKPLLRCGGLADRVLANTKDTWRGCGYLLVGAGHGRRRYGFKLVHEALEGLWGGLLLGHSRGLMPDEQFGSILLDHFLKCRGTSPIWRGLLLLRRYTLLSWPYYHRLACGCIWLLALALVGSNDCHVVLCLLMVWWCESAMMTVIIGGTRRAWISIGEGQVFGDQFVWEACVLITAVPTTPTHTRFRWVMHTGIIVMSMVVTIDLKLLTISFRSTLL